MSFLSNLILLQKSVIFISLVWFLPTPHFVQEPHTMAEIRRFRNEKPFCEPCQKCMGPCRFPTSTCRPAMVQIHSHGGGAGECAGCSPSVWEVDAMATRHTRLALVHKIWIKVCYKFCFLICFSVSALFIKNNLVVYIFPGYSLIRPLSIHHILAFDLARKHWGFKELLYQ